MTVLVIDDSALVRQALLAVLGSQADMKVTVAGDPIIAIERMRRARPDVIVLDLEMPRMDGLTFLEKLMRDDPVPVVICSGNAQGGSEAAMRALQLGALDVVSKPSVGLRDFFEESARRLIETVRAAAQVHIREIRPAAAGVPAPPLVVRLPAHPRLVAIGASMGGPAALRHVLSALRGACPPMVISQHMPPGFTASLARNLTSETGVETREAVDGDRPAPGRVLLAPGGRHLLVRRRAGELRVELSSAPPENGCRPSIDAMFRSMALSAKNAAVGVLLTGMGTDGAAGLLEMRQAGAATIAQDEATCAVYGMPRAAVALGATSEVVAIHRIAWAIARAAGAHPRPARSLA